ncbi:unnamed protein product [Camellia sinensis]
MGHLRGGRDEMFASQFDGNSAFSGGGFTSSQSTQATDIGSSSAKNRNAYGVVPITVKQISESAHSGDEKSNYVVDGVDVVNVTLIGMVSKKTERVTDVAFTLDDGTGRIDCNRWVNEAFDSKEMENIQDGIYVRVNGLRKSLQGRRQLIAFSVRPVTNFDEISFHFIECIHFHLQNSKTKLQGNTTTQPQSVNPNSCIQCHQWGFTCWQQIGNAGVYDSSCWGFFFHRSHEDGCRSISSLEGGEV